jgi:peptidoglycan/xylan/chitin deacetylase (PgdA/CDA1 family)
LQQFTGPEFDELFRHFRTRKFRIFLAVFLLLMLVVVPCTGLFWSTNHSSRATTKAAEKQVAYAKISTDRTYRTVFTGKTLTMKIQCDATKKHPKPHLTFRSSDKNIATVSKKGRIHARKPGEAVITCKAPNDQKLRLKLFVRKKSSHVVYLTYDDGPGAHQTPKLLRVLKKYNAHATFFVVGSQAKRHPKLIRRELENGNAVGIHTYTHNYRRIYKNGKAYFRDFERTEALLEKIAGQRTNYVRMPGGSNNGFVKRKTSRRIIRRLHQKGYHVMDWTAASQDAVGVRYSTRQLTRFAIRTSRGQNPKIILMHDSDAKPHTAAVTRNVIKYYKKKGYTFESLETYEGKDILFLNL